MRLFYLLGTVAKDSLVSRCEALEVKLMLVESYLRTDVSGCTMCYRFIGGFRVIVAVYTVFKHRYLDDVSSSEQGAESIVWSS